jgi:hypothetical protein
MKSNSNTNTKAKSNQIPAESAYVRPYTDPINFLISNRVQQLGPDGADQLYERLQSKSFKQ